MIRIQSECPHLADDDRPEQLVFEDDPSFLPEFALPPPEFFADIDHRFNLDLPHSGDTQTLTPFGSQQSLQSSRIGGYGLVLPSSTPDRPVGGGLQGGQDNNEMLDIDKLLQLNDPEFAFGEDGEIIEFTPGSRAQAAPATPVNARAVPMHSDADASARVRQDHEEVRHRGEQVSSTALSHSTHITFSLIRPLTGCYTPCLNFHRLLAHGFSSSISPHRASVWRPLETYACS